MVVSWRWTQWLAVGALAGVCTGPVTLDTGLTGIVVRGPITPVCQANVPCDAPFAATFEARQSNRRIATFSSDAQGRFIVRLPPGRYDIVPGADAPIMNGPAQVKTVDVGPEGLTSVELMFDTGIR